jgi:hypothetical protein
LSSGSPSRHVWTSCCTSMCVVHLCAFVRHKPFAAPVWCPTPSVAKWAQSIMAHTYKHDQLRLGSQLCGISCRLDCCNACYVWCGSVRLGRYYALLENPCHLYVAVLFFQIEITVTGIFSYAQIGHTPSPVFTPKCNCSGTSSSCVPQSCSC